jgi:hypothetical protein
MASRRLGLAFAFIVACGGSTIDLTDASTQQDGATDGTLVCNGGTVACGDKCVQLQLDPNNCGSCDHLCSITQVCANGTCQANCPVGYTLCNGSCTNMQSDTQNCGKCGSVCGGANAAPTCNAGTCTLTCTSTFSDCNKSPTDGCEVDLSSDDKNCGACGHDCLGGACAGSVCQPFALATGESYPWALAIDGSNVYWTTLGGAIRTVAKTGGTPTSLATGQGYPYGIAVDGANAYWANTTSGVVESCAKGGCSSTPTALATNQGYVYGIATDGKNVYWAQYQQNGELRKCAVGGCSDTPTTLVSATYGYQVATDGTDVFFTQNGAKKCSVNGCSSATTLGSVGWGGITVDGTNAYWMGNNDVLECAKGGCGGSPTVLGSGYASGVAVDSTDVYWTGAGTGTVSRCAITGCSSPTVLTSGQAYPEGIAVDATYVYFANYTSGIIARLAK